MRTSLLAVAALAAVASSPASAAVVIGFENVSTDQNVLFGSSTEVSSPTLVAATNQTQTPVTFLNALGLFANASGQSSTTTSSDGMFGTTLVTIASGSIFSTASFNLPGIPGNPPPAEATSVLVEALGLGGGVIQSTMLALNGNGENRIGISGTMSEQFSGFRVTLAPTGAGVGSMTQVRLGGVSTIAQVGAVPEPATWAMMLLGFTFLGASLRRKQRQTLRVRFN